MPRIRTIKPEFFTDSKTGRLSSDAKVLFAGLWCHADDYGIIRYDLEEFKAKILPYQSTPAEESVGRPLMAEILPAGLAVYFVVFDDSESTRRGIDEGSPGVPYLWITNFAKHQRIDRPSQPLISGWGRDASPFTWSNAQIIGAPELPIHPSPGDESTSARRGLDEHSTPERKGKERKGVEGKGDIPPPVASATGFPHGGLVPLEAVQGQLSVDYDAFVAELNGATGRRFQGDQESRRKYAIVRRSGRSAEDLLAAARGVAKSAHHMGLNDSQIPYNAPINVLRSKVLDQLIALGTGEIGVSRRATADEQRQDEISEWARRRSQVQLQ